jgi:hypothetical protein
MMVISTALKNLCRRDWHRVTMNRAGRSLIGLNPIRSQWENAKLCRADERWPPLSPDKVNEQLQLGRPVNAS